MTVDPRLQPFVLEGRHVRLEPLTLDHLDALAGIALDPDLWRWTGANVVTRDDLRRYLAEAIEERDRGVSLPFATIDRASGRAAGSTRFGNIALAHRRVEIGWTWLGRPFQRTALNTEAKHLMLSHAFEVWGCNRVELKTDVLNARSRNAMLRIGATEEGVLRQHLVTETGRVRDTIYYSILRDEWPEVKARIEGLMARGA